MKGKLSSLVIISLFLLIIPAAHCSDKSAEVLKLSSVKLTTDEDITKAILWAQIKNTGTMSLDSSCKVHFYVRNSDKTIDQVVGDVFCTATDHQGNSGPLGKGEIRWYKYEWPVPERADMYKYWASVMEGDRRISAWSSEKAFNIKDKRILFIRGEESDNVKKGSVADSSIFGYSSLYKSLIEEGFEVEEITNPIITSKLLELYDIAVFSGRWENRVLDDSEARAFVDYVNNGGNLLLMSQYYRPSLVTNDLDSVNKIGSIIGVSFSYGVVCDPNSYLSEVNKPVIADIIDHDVTRGITKFNLNWGTSLVVSTPSKAIAYTSPNAWLDTNSIWIDKSSDLRSVKDDNEPRQKLPVLAVGEYGYGKFVAIGDAGSIDDGDIDNYNNKNLAKNIFNWLSLPTTKNHPPKAIRLEPNGDTDVKVGELVKFKIKVEDLDDEKEDQHMVMWFIDNKWEITSLTDKETKEAIFIYKFETPGIFNIKATAYDMLDMSEDSVAWLVNAGTSNVIDNYIIKVSDKNGDAIILATIEIDGVTSKTGLDGKAEFEVTSGKHTVIAKDDCGETKKEHNFGVDPPDENDAEVTLRIETCPPAIKLFEKSYYSGASKEIAKHESRFLDDFNDKASSVKLPNDRILILYEHSEFGGESRIFEKDTPDLGDFSAKASSFKLVWPGAPIVTLYYDENYAGKFKHIPGDIAIFDETEIPQLGIAYLDFNDMVSSIKVPNGYKVIIYEDVNYEGESRLLTNDNPRLGDLAFNDKMSSLKLIPVDVPVVILYQDANFMGESKHITIDTPSLGVPYLSFCDTISSIKVHDGYKAIIFEDNDYEGKSRALYVDTPYLGDLNDKLSSVKIESVPPDTPIITLFEDCNYLGDSRSYTTDTPWLEDFDQKTSSVKIKPSGYSVTLYSDKNYGGFDVEFSNDVPCLNEGTQQLLFNDQISSLKIKRNRL